MMMIQLMEKARMASCNVLIIIMMMMIMMKHNNEG